MKKMLSLGLAMMLAFTLICAITAAAEVPQPEGGKKFESDWAKMNGLIEIVYEEEGYRVMVDLYNQVDQIGTQWEYSCYYVEEKDALVSISSCKSGYTMNPETMEITRGDYEYEGLDEENKESVFSLTEDGALEWFDGHEDMGADLEFRDIGRFAGVWRNDEEEVYTEFLWLGLYDESTWGYSVFIHRGGEEQYTDFNMEGIYSPETGKLEASGTAISMIRNAEGHYDAQEDGETYEAIFSWIGDGKILYETANGIELEYDILGPES